MQSSSSPHLDLTGKLIIKVALGEDIRRIPIHNEEITYDELVLMMQRVYRGKLSTSDDITIKYKDEDGDLITIFDSSDLTFAIQCSRILKITLFVNSSSTPALASAEASMIRKDLQEVRDRVIGLLDKLGSSDSLGAHSMGLGDGIVGQVAAVPSIKSEMSAPTSASGGKEFDPLQSQKSADDSTQNKVMASFGVDGNATSAAQQYDRAATPDSVSSVASSASKQQNQLPPQQIQIDARKIFHTYQQYQRGQPPQSAQAPQQQQPAAAAAAYAGQPGYPQGQMPPQAQPGQMPPQAYPGQSAYGSPQPPQGAMPPQQQQQQAPGQQQQQPYDPAMYGQYGQAYGAPAPGQAPHAQQAQQAQPPQGHMMYGQQGAPNPYAQAQAPGMPQAQQPKNPGYPPSPGQASGNPYSRNGPGYPAGYPRPTAGYPQ